ncbi:MAG: D-alanyl-D-alanine carboxypeptidase, partial [Pseudomonadota bacterium]|nr:D-alanyl-D-alanine carboxypeptidase [Pseudomonadota bacterium]
MPIAFRSVARQAGTTAMAWCSLTARVAALARTLCTGLWLAIGAGVGLGLTADMASAAVHASARPAHGGSVAHRHSTTQPGGVVGDRAGKARGATALPPAISAILRESGLPTKSFALDVRSVETADVPALLALNAEQPFLLASTTKLVTSLAALDLLGPGHRWRTTAYATGPVNGGRLGGDLVIVGGEVGLTGSELRRWFAQMRDEGVQTISGNIVLEGVALLHERDPKQARTTEEERSVDAPIDARTYNKDKLLVSVQPAAGERALVTVKPRPANVRIVNEVWMGGGCAAWARWKSADEIEAGPPLQLWVRGRWQADCGAQDIAYVAPPADLRLEPELCAAAALPIAAPRMVAELWAEAGGS